jgi:hypothetical protein
MKRIIFIIVLLASFTIAKGQAPKQQGSPYKRLAQLDSSYFTQGQHSPTAAQWQDIMNNCYNDTLIKFTDSTLLINVNGSMVLSSTSKATFGDTVIVNSLDSITGNVKASGTCTFNGSSIFNSTLSLKGQFIPTYIADTATVNRTLKGSEVIFTSINATQSAGRAFTLPLGSSIDTALGLPASTANIAIDFVVNNIGGTGNDSLIANTGVTFGTYPAIYGSYATGTISTLVVAGQARHFVLFRSNTGTYTLYKPY